MRDVTEAATPNTNQMSKDVADLTTESAVSVIDPDQCSTDVCHRVLNYNRYFASTLALDQSRTVNP